MTLFLDQNQVRRHLSMHDLIPAMEQALTAFSAGQVQQPVRTALLLERQAGFFGIMPAVLEGGMGLKAVTFYPGNAARNLPTHMATIFLADPETGAPLAIMDGTLITEMRTAAVSAVATRLFANPKATSLALLGSGVQAASHLEALRLVRDFTDIRVWSRTPEHARRFAEAHGARALSAEEAVRGADVVVAATSSMAPVLHGAWLKPGAHVNAVGACRPDWRELDDAAMRNIVYVDSRAAAAKEAGDVILSNAKIEAELGEALARGAAWSPDRTTIFKSLGLAVEDVASALLVWRAARAR